MRDLVAPAPGLHLLMLQLDRARRMRRTLHDPLLVVIALAFLVELGLFVPLACAVLVFQTIEWCSKHA